jgi:hypothetical protein
VIWQEFAEHFELCQLLLQDFEFYLRSLQQEARTEIFKSAASSLPQQTPAMSFDKINELLEFIGGLRQACKSAQMSMDSLIQLEEIVKGDSTSSDSGLNNPYEARNTLTMALDLYYNIPMTRPPVFRPEATGVILPSVSQQTRIKESMTIVAVEMIIKSLQKFQNLSLQEQQQTSEESINPKSKPDVDIDDFLFEGEDNMHDGFPNNQVWKDLGRSLVVAFGRDGGGDVSHDLANEIASRVTHLHLNIMRGLYRQSTRTSTTATSAGVKAVESYLKEICGVFLEQEHSTPPDSISPSSTSSATPDLISSVRYRLVDTSGYVDTPLLVSEIVKMWISCNGIQYSLRWWQELIKSRISTSSLPSSIPSLGSPSVSSLVRFQTLTAEAAETILLTQAELVSALLIKEKDIFEGLRVSGVLRMLNPTLNLRWLEVLGDVGFKLRWEKHQRITTGDDSESGDGNSVKLEDFGNVSGIKNLVRSDLGEGWVTLRNLNGSAAGLASSTSIAIVSNVNDFESVTGPSSQKQEINPLLWVALMSGLVYNKAPSLVKDLDSNVLKRPDEETLKRLLLGIDNDDLVEADHWKARWNCWVWFHGSDVGEDGVDGVSCKREDVLGTAMLIERDVMSGKVREGLVKLHEFQTTNERAVGVLEQIPQSKQHKRRNEVDFIAYQYPYIYTIRSLVQRGLLSEALVIFQALVMRLQHHIDNDENTAKLSDMIGDVALESVKVLLKSVLLNPTKAAASVDSGNIGSLEYESDRSYGQRWLQTHGLDTQMQTNIPIENAVDMESDPNSAKVLILPSEMHIRRGLELLKLIFQKIEESGRMLTILRSNLISEDLLQLYYRGCLTTVFRRRKSQISYQTLSMIPNTEVHSLKEDRSIFEEAQKMLLTEIIPWLEHFAGTPKKMSTLIQQMAYSTMVSYHLQRGSIFVELWNIGKGRGYNDIPPPSPSTKHDLEKVKPNKAISKLERVMMHLDICETLMAKAYSEGLEISLKVLRGLLREYQRRKASLDESDVEVKKVLEFRIVMLEKEIERRESTGAMD